jgi:flagellar biosynthesis protein FlhB
MSEAGDQEDKTEDPTQRKLEQALEKGDVPKSSEVSTFFLLAAATLAFMIFARSNAHDLAISLQSFLGNIHQFSVDGQALRAIGKHSLTIAMAAIGVPMLFLVIAGIAGNMSQHSLVWSTESLGFKFSRISPMAGFKRVFGKEALVQFAKGLLKMIIVGVAVVIALWPQRMKLESMVQFDVASLSPVMLSLILKLMGATLAIFIFIAAGDFAYQRFTWYKRQKMTKQEIKEEQKETDGNPEIKQKIKQLRSRAARKRMMAAVPKASVIITNPTHYAIALRYEAGMNAPICVAKGLDAIALKIREIAGEYNIPIVENKPLARALHATVDIDGEIPAEHYKAVAEVIGYVMRFRKTTN